MNKKILICAVLSVVVLIATFVTYGMNPSKKERGDLRWTTYSHNECLWKAVIIEKSDHLITQLTENTIYNASLSKDKCGNKGDILTFEKTYFSNTFDNLSSYSVGQTVDISLSEGGPLILKKK